MPSFNKELEWDGWVIRLEGNPSSYRWEATIKIVKLSGTVWLAKNTPLDDVWDMAVKESTEYVEGRNKKPLREIPPPDVSPSPSMPPVK